MSDATYLCCGYYILYINPEINMENGCFLFAFKIPNIPRNSGFIPQNSWVFFPTFKNCGFFAILHVSGIDRLCSVPHYKQYDQFYGQCYPFFSRSVSEGFLYMRNFVKKSRHVSYERMKKKYY